MISAPPLRCSHIYSFSNDGLANAFPKYKIPTENPATTKIRIRKAHEISFSFNTQINKAPLKQSIDEKLLDFPMIGHIKENTLLNYNFLLFIRIFSSFIIPSLYTRHHFPSIYVIRYIDTAPFSIIRNIPKIYFLFSFLQSIFHVVSRFFLDGCGNSNMFVCFAGMLSNGWLLSMC